MRGESVRPKAEGAEASFGLGELNRIGVEAEEASTGLEAGKEFLRVAAVAERAIDCDIAGLGGECFQDFRDHDGPVHARGRLAGGEDFRDRPGVALRVALLVFLIEAPRVFASVARTAAVGRCCSRVMPVRSRPAR